MQMITLPIRLMKRLGVDTIIGKLSRRPILASNVLIATQSPMLPVV